MQWRIGPWQGNRGELSDRWPWGGYSVDMRTKQKNTTVAGLLRETVADLWGMWTFRVGLLCVALGFAPFWLLSMAIASVGGGN